jgi:hypothetical protein
MAYLTEREVRDRAKQSTDTLRKSARDVLVEARADAVSSFDVFS